MTIQLAEAVARPYSWGVPFMGATRVVVLMLALLVSSWNGRWSSAAWGPIGDAFDVPPGVPVQLCAPERGGSSEGVAIDEPFALVACSSEPTAYRRGAEVSSFRRQSATQWRSPARGMERERGPPRVAQFSIG